MKTRITIEVFHDPELIKPDAIATVLRHAIQNINFEFEPKEMLAATAIKVEEDPGFTYVKENK